MKKWIAFLLVFFLAFVLFGCEDGPDPDKDKDKFEVKTVTISGNQPTMNVGDEVQLTAKIEPAEAPQTVSWSSKNEAVATVSETGLVKAVGAGVVEIVATSTVKTRATRTVSIQVIEPIVYDDPTSVTVTGTQKEFRVNSFITLVAKVYPLPNESTGVTGAIQSVIWESSDQLIATVNASGKVSGLAVGKATITATVVADPTLKDSFDIEVVAVQDIEVPTVPTEIQVRGEKRVEEEYQIALLATVFPSGVSQNVTWTSETPDLASVNQRGVVTGLKAGTAIIKAASNVNLDIYRYYEVVVTPQVQVPAPKNLNKYEIVIMAAPHATHEHDPELDNYKGLDKTAKLAAWSEVEDLFNCTMVVIGFPDTAPWGPKRVSYIKEKAALGQAETDIFVSTTDWLVDFAVAGATVDVSDFYDVYGRNSMNPGVRYSATYKGGLYALPFNDYGSIKPYHGLFYNLNLLENLGLDNPAQLFNEGEWTWNKFKEYVTNAASLLETGQSVLSGKTVGLFYGMVNAAGVSLVDPAAMTINFNHGHAVNAANLIRDIYLVEHMWGDNAWDAENPSFNTGKSIFQVAEYWFVKEGNRFPVDMWGEGTTRYGYVPFPYPDSMKKEETRVSYQGGAIYQMSTGRVYPTGVTAEDVYRVFAEMMIGTTRRMQADPEIDEDVLMVRAAEFKLDDPESITAISYFKGDMVIYDPYYALLPSWSHAGPMGDAFIVSGQDYGQVANTYYPQFLQAMNDFFS